MKQGFGNCVDQSVLAVDLLTGLGFEAKVVKLTVTGNCGSFTGGHEHVEVNDNGAWRIWDTSCHGLSYYKHS